MRRLIPAAVLGIMLMALLAATLVACGDGGGGSTEQPSNGEAATGASEPTPDTRTQGGAQLTTEEYAAAMEEIAAARERKFEAAGEALFSGDLFSSDQAERLSSLETSESWSDDDAEFASESAETMQRALAGLAGDFLRITRDSLDEISSLSPPEHLSGLHDDYVAASRKFLPVAQDFVETLQDAETNIENRDELADFMALLDSGPTDAEGLEQRAERVCLELESQLEADLERNVSICDPDGSDGTSAGPAVEPAPTAATAADDTSAETDREALVALYHATGGPNWTDNTNWLSDAPLAEWHGVDTLDGRVVGLELYANRLSGEIPAQLGQLADLWWLDLSDNQLSGEIPSGLGHLSNLDYLNLGDNDLSGEIPSELGQLADLEDLQLYFNNLTGSIPPELGQLTNLEYLDLGDNDLSGEIPAELGQLSLLTSLYLSGNDLSGCIPGALRDVDENDLGELGLEFC